MGSFRDRSRNQARVSPGRVRKPRRMKIAPARACPCRVNAPTGEYYDLDSVLNILEINPSNPEGFLFKSRRKASSRIYWTIRRYVDEGDVWSEKRYVLENVI